MNIPHIPLVTAQVREPDYRFIELMNLEVRGTITGEELAELDDLCRQKEALPDELRRDGTGEWM